MSEIVIVFDPVLFRQQFPAFANETTFPTPMLQMYWDMAINYISDVNCGDLQGDGRVLAINLMTAHLLALSLVIAAGSAPGLVQSSTVDKITVSLTPPPIPNQWQWWMNQTPYGAQLLSLLQVNSAGGFYSGGLPEGDAFLKVYGAYYGPSETCCG